MTYYIICYCLSYISQAPSDWIVSRFMALYTHILLFFNYYIFLANQDILFYIILYLSVECVYEDVMYVSPTGNHFHQVYHPDYYVFFLHLP